jgi:hypothetical protein
MWNVAMQRETRLPPVRKWRDRALRTSTAPCIDRLLRTSSRALLKL